MRPCVGAGSAFTRDGSIDGLMRLFGKGVLFAELLSPVECVPDEWGKVKALRFERQSVADGRVRGTGEVVELPARSVMVAAGTSPNVIYE